MAPPPPPPPPPPAPPTGAIWQIGFGGSFYKDAGKTTLATADGDLVYVAADAIGSNDMLQATSANRPILDTKTFAPAQAVQFQPWRVTSLESDTGPAYSLQAFSLCLLFSMIDPFNNQGTPIFLYNQFIPGPLYRLFWQNRNPMSDLSGFATGSNFAEMSGAVFTYGAHVLILVGSASAFDVYLDGVQLGGFTAITDANTAYKFSLGTVVGQYPAHMAVAGSMIWNRALNAGEITQLQSYASSYATVGTTFDSTKAAFVWMGDSLMASPLASDDAHRLPDQTFALLTNGATYSRSYAMYGNPGATIVQWQGAGPSAILDAYYDAARPQNVMVVWMGTNDSNYVTAYANLKTFCAARKTVGWTVIVVDMLPRTPGSNEAARTTFNNSLAGDFTTTYATGVKHGGATYADVLVQLSVDATIGQANSWQNATNYPDGTHLSDAGYAVAAPYLVSALNFLGYT